MSRPRVLSSPMASAAAFALVVLVLAAPALAAPTEAADKAAAPYEAADATGAASNRKDRQKKQTTTVCIQVSPTRPGAGPVVLCGDSARDLAEQQQRLQTPVFQQPQPGYFGSPNIVQIVPASDSLTVSAPGYGRLGQLGQLQRTESVLLSPGFSSPSDTFGLYRTGPGAARSADSAAVADNSPAPATAPAPAAPAPAAPAPAAPAPAPREPAVRDVFANPDTKSAPASPAVSAAPAAAAAAPAVAQSAAPTPAAHQTQARSFGGDETVIVSSQSGPHRPFSPFNTGTQEVSVIRKQQPFSHGGSQQVEVISTSSGMGGMGGMGGGYPHQPLGPPMIGGMNFRAAETKDNTATAPAGPVPAPAAPGAPQKQQARTAVLLQPIVMQRDLVIPAVGSVSAGPSAPVIIPPPAPAAPATAVRTQIIAPVASLPAYALPSQRQQVGVSGIATIPVGGSTIPVTLNCDLSTLGLRGLPQQQQFKVGAGPASATVTASASATARAQEQQIQDILKEIKQAGSSEGQSPAVALQAIAEQANKMRAAAMSESEFAPSAPPAEMQDMSPTQLEERMRSAGYSTQMRYVAEPSPISASSVSLGVSPGGFGGSLGGFGDLGGVSSSGSDFGGQGFGGQGFGNQGFGGQGFGGGFRGQGFGGQSFGGQSFGGNSNYGRGEGSGFGSGFGSGSSFGGYRAAESQPQQPQQSQQPQQPQQAQQPQRSQQPQQPQLAQQPQHTQQSAAARAAEAEDNLKQLRQMKEDLVSQLTSKGSAPPAPTPSPQQVQAREAEQQAFLDRLRQAQYQQLRSSSSAVTPVPEQQQQIIQPATGAEQQTKLQQEMLRQLRDAQEDLLMARAATLPREQSSTSNLATASSPAPSGATVDVFEPTPGYKHVDAREAFGDRPRYL